MKTYRIDAVYSNHNHKTWLVIGCPEEEVLDYVNEFFNELRDDGERLFKSISFSEE